MTLSFWIILYLLISIGIGLYASRRVKNETDYILAGRGLPIYITIATTFATWFGSETVLWTSSTFINEWLSWILADPFWAGLCLILVWLFFARPLYRMGVKTLGDFYKIKYGRTVEVFASIMIIVSYIGWVSAQIVALGLIFDILTEWSQFAAITQAEWSFIGGGIVLFYTIFWGMWSVAMTDFFQMIIIVVWLFIAMIYVGDKAGGVTNVISLASSEGRFNIFPEWVSIPAIIAALAAMLTLGFWSIPQQDVFQRTLSANSEKNAGRGVVIGGSLYIIVAFVPILLGYAAFIVAPDLVSKYIETDSQHILPELILTQTPLFVQVMFFGALLSAIMSTASGTLLAPSALFAENILKPFLPGISDKKLLFVTRSSVFGFFFIIMSFVWYKYQNSEANIFSMVENAYKITLAWALVPLVAGIYCKRVHTVNAIISMLVWVGTWISLEYFIEVEEIYYMPPHFFAFLVSIPAFFLGGVLYRWSHNNNKSPDNSDDVL